MSAMMTGGGRVRREGDEWLLAGAAGETIRGSTDPPPVGATARAIVLFAHGFKGYKDYGFIPVLAARMAARVPAVVHRFNFSHSGMGANVSTFERPDLFERDTWSKQVFDLGAVDAAARAGAMPSAAGEAARSLPVVWMGHSRGGATCLMAAGRRFRDGDGPTPDAIVTIAAPAEACRMSEADRQTLRAGGFVESPSSRTGQRLRVGPEFLREIERAPADHEVLALARRIACPVLAAHGFDDPTVAVEDAERIARACPRGERAVIEGANHVFNTPNPADPEAPLSPALEALSERAIGFIGQRL